MHAKSIFNDGAHPKTMALLKPVPGDGRPGSSPTAGTDDVLQIWRHHMPCKYKRATTTRVVERQAPDFFGPLDDVTLKA